MQYMENIISKNQITSILQSKNLTSLFQPVIDLNRASVYGHEALIRGPVETELHAPLTLFEACHLVGLTPEMEFLSREIVLQHYVNSNDKNKLFVNVSPHCLQLNDSPFTFNCEQLDYLGLTPSDIVIEITEGSSIKDFGKLRDTVNRYRDMGLQLP